MTTIQNPKPTASRPWHPVEDAISPIIEAIKHFLNTAGTDLHERLAYQYMRPSTGLAHAFNKPAIGVVRGIVPSSRREMLRRWLQNNGYPNDAHETEMRLDRLLRRAKNWEDSAQSAWAKRESYCMDLEEKGAQVGFLDRFGEEVREQFSEVETEAEEAANYFGQLRATIEARQRRSETGPAQSAPSIHPTVQSAFDYIKANPGAKGNDIARAIYKTPEHFRQKIVPQLKLMGVTNNGDGYHPPKAM